MKFLITLLSVLEWVLLSFRLLSFRLILMPLMGKISLFVEK